MQRLVLLAAVYAWSWCGCAPSTTKAAVYAAELQACVERSPTLAQSRLCRCDVSTRYGRACDDAGAP